MPDNFRIEFAGCQQSANGVPVFTAGQVVSGKVILQTTEPMKARHMHLNINGSADVHWTKEQSETWTDSQGQSHTRYNTIHYRGNEDYLKQKATIWSAFAASEQHKLPPGLHIFPFQFTIPSYCPPSFEGEYGHIRYSCSVNIDRPWRFDKKFKGTFVVAPYVDLNRVDPAFLQPVQWPITKGIGFFSKSLITAKFSLPRRGFVPGEKIPFKIDVENGTSKWVKKVKAKLVQEIVYTSSGGHKKWNTRKLCQMEEHFLVGAKSKGTFQGHLTIPPCVPSINTSKCIRMDYHLEVRVEVDSLLGTSIALPIPILIGTIPLRHAPPPSIGIYPKLLDPQMGISHPEPNAPPPDVDDFSSAPPPSPPPLPPYPEGPPSYEQSVLGTGKGKHENGEYRNVNPYQNNLA